MIESVTEQLKQIISQDLDVNLKQEEIDDEVSLFEGGLGLDSVVIMEFISLIEARFGFKFSDDELNMEQFKNLKILAEFVSAKAQQP